VTLRARDLERILEHARAGYPYEVCGVLLGRLGSAPARIEAVREVENRERESPRTRYVIAPEDLLQVDRQARQHGLEVLGYYHSHPDHPARPSETDRRLAAESLSDGVLHMVVSVHGGRTTEAQAWVFRDARKQFEPEPLSVDAQTTARQAEEDSWL
jgi:proteasome lid subunit RPN8/RPN11